MDQTLDALLGFAPDTDSPIPYMRRTREYYAAIGYTTPYRWAHYLTAPFTPLSKPLRDSKNRDRHDGGALPAGQGRPGAGARPTTAAPSSTPSTPATRRPTTTCESRILATTGPIPRRPTATPGSRCRRCAAPPRRTHRCGRPALPWRADQPQPARHGGNRRAGDPGRLRDDGADAVLIVPNCPVCHQTGTLVARHLEANGIPTVVMGCAKDIVEHAAAPRFLFSDFPLGNSAGKPHDVASQDQTLELALRLLESAPGSADHDAVAAALGG